MNDVFFVPTAIATAVSYLVFAFWIAGYVLSFGTFLEGLALGASIGGLLCGVAFGVARPNEAQEENGG